MFSCSTPEGEKVVSLEDSVKCCDTVCTDTASGCGFIIKWNTYDSTKSNVVEELVK